MHLIFSTVLCKVARDCFGSFFVVMNRVVLIFGHVCQVEMEHLKRLNVQKLPLGRTPRRVLYHSVSKTLIVMQTDPGPDGNLVSDLCCVDPVSGASHSCYTLDAGEVARSIQLWKHRQELLLLVGTSLTKGGVMSSGEAERYLH